MTAALIHLRKVQIISWFNGENPYQTREFAQFKYYR